MERAKEEEVMKKKIKITQFLKCWTIFVTYATQKPI